MHLVLGRVSPDDFDQLLPVGFRAYTNDPMLPVFWGHGGPVSYAHVKSLWRGALREPVDAYLKVIDSDSMVDVHIIDSDGNRTGEVRKQKRIVGACDWKVYATSPYIFPQSEEKHEQETNFLPTAKEQADADSILSDIYARRRLDPHDPHLRCSEICVDPDYGRRGIGTMMMQWGSNVADAMGVECRIEATEQGRGLYTKMGYEVVERVERKTGTFDATHTRMRRPVQVKQ